MNSEFDEKIHSQVAVYVACRLFPYLELLVVAALFAVYHLASSFFHPQSPDEIQTKTKQKYFTFEINFWKQQKLGVEMYQELQQIS